MDAKNYDKLQLFPDSPHLYCIVESLEATICFFALFLPVRKRSPLPHIRTPLLWSERAKFSPLLAASAFSLILTLCTHSPSSLHAQTPSPPQEGVPQAIQQYHIEESPEKVFGAVEVKIRRIFDPPRNAIYRMANRLKISTREKMILQEVQFQEGEPYSNFLLSETARVLRTLRYLRDIRVIPIDRGDVVDVVIEVQDTWTIIPQMSFASGDGRTRKSVGISEGNFLGTGNRAELLYREDEGADTLQAVFDSRRLLGTKYQGVVGLANGAEGEEYLYDIGDPFRSLAQKTAWSHSALFGDTIERLFAAAEERFIYRKQTERVGGSYAFTLGSPEDALKRFQLGFQYLSESFREASASDFEDIGVDPETLRPEGGELAENRKFVGPTAGYQFIEQDFIRRNYIDRFVRVEDFNLGERFSSAVQWAPSLLESREDTLLWSTSYGDGYELEGLSFARWESRIESRLISEGFENTIFSLEGQYFNPLGEVEIGGRSLGYHTLVFRALLDYADNLDFDKELLVGGDNILRGYDARTFTGDKRYALNFEDRIHLAENVYDLISVGMAFFADVGGATRESLGELYTDNTFANVGVGLRLAFPKSNGERVVRIDLALPLRAGPDGSDSFELRVIFSGGQLFGSRLGTERASSQQVGVDLGF